MDAIESLLGGLLSTLYGYFSAISITLYQYKIIIFIVALLLLLFYRVVLANLLRVHRRDKLDWVIWGILFAIQIFTLFITKQTTWLIAQLLIWAAAIAYAFIQDNVRQVRTTIYSKSIIYQDTSTQYEVNKDNDKEALTKKKDAKVHRSWSTSRMHWIMGMPVLMQKFTFKISTTATQEVISQAVANLNNYYEEYNWRKIRTSNGLSYEFTAEVKINKNLIVEFDMDISNELDWYAVPLGAVDVSNKKTAKETPYVWMLHDPKTEGKSYGCLANAKTFPPSPHGFIVGSTGGGKSVLLNTILSHFINKARTDNQTKLYLADAKHVEFAPYASLKEIEGIALTLEDAVDLTNHFREEMLKRNELMEKEGIKKIPLDGKLQLHNHICINGKYLPNETVLEIKLQDGTITHDYALNLEKRTDVVEVNMPEEEKEEEEEKSSMPW